MRGVMFVLFAVGSVCSAEDAKPLTPLDLKGVAVVQPKEGVATKPTEIKSADELAKSPLFGEGGAEKVGKLVDFKTQKLVVFAWSGSGQDKVELTVSAMTPSAVFRYIPGKTRDLRPHFHAYAVPKDVEVKAEKNLQK
jgi:hypothetical protein